MAANIITRTPNITKLSIIFDRFWLPHLQETHAEACRRSIETLFTIATNPSQFPRLRSLSLRDFGLEQLGPVLSKSVDFKTLEELRFVRCGDVANMLSSLRLQQVDWKMLHIEEEACISDNGELKSLLQTMVAPKVLSIGRDRSNAAHFGGGELCWTDLMLHSPTLKSLRLNIEKADGRPFHDRHGKKLADFHELCKSASNLEQLALMTPHIEEQTWEEKDGFSAFLVRAPITLSFRDEY
jgi:hypothetical protein